MTFTIRWRVLGSAAKAAWPLWLTGLGVFDAFLIAAAIGWLVTTTLGVVVQTAGILLSLLGICTTVVGLIDSRRRFKRPSLRASISKWFGLVASAFGQRHHQVALSGSVAMSGSVGAVLVKGSRAPVTVEERLTALEQDVRDLRAATTSAAEGLRRDVRTLTRDLQQERDEREAGDKRALQEVEELAAGGFDLAMVGVFWTITGTVLASPVGEWAGRLMPR